METERKQGQNHGHTSLFRTVRLNPAAPAVRCAGHASYDRTTSVPDPMSHIQLGALDCHSPPWHGPTRVTPTVARYPIVVSAPQPDPATSYVIHHGLSRCASSRSSASRSTSSPPPCASSDSTSPPHNAAAGSWCSSWRSQRGLEARTISWWMVMLSSIASSSGTPSCDLRSEAISSSAW
eukprot:120519-Prymnesium_polylepis.1